MELPRLVKYPCLSTGLAPGHSWVKEPRPLLPKTSASHAADQYPNLGIDLLDGKTNCTGNLWRASLFRTANQPVRFSLRGALLSGATSTIVHVLAQLTASVEGY